MANNITLNAPTSTGAVVGTDELIISTATVHVQRVKVGFGTEGVWTNIASGSALPVFIEANTATIGNVGLSAGTATVGTVLLGANTATVGTVNIAAQQGIYLQTSTGGTIPADTTSGLTVKYNSTPTVVIGAGTATIGTLLIEAGTATIGTVLLGAGTATIGTVAANFASGSGFFLKTATGGTVPADTTSGLAVKFVNTPTVAANFASGAGFFLKTSTGGTIPADTTSGITVKFGSNQTILVGANTATIGTVNANLISGGSVYLQTSTGGAIPADTTSGLAVKFVNNPTVVVGAGTATIGTVNVQTATTVNVSLATTQAILLNTQPSLATGSFGPKTVNITASGSTALVSSPGANASLYITSLRVINSATTVQKIAFSDGSERDKGSAAANGGGWTQYYNPPWKLPGNTALNAVATDAVNMDVTVHFYNGAT